MNNKDNKNSIFYLIGIIVDAAAVVTGAVVTAIHFLNKRKAKDDELVYEIDCDQTDCEKCELCDECDKDETESTEEENFEQDCE